MDDRERIWKLLFGDKPMPEQREGAVDDAFGMLNDKLGDISKEEFNAILMQAKGKGPFICNEDDEDDDEGFWDAFCEEHFKEALEHITKKYKGYDVGYSDATPFNEDDIDISEDEWICGYPDCNKIPTKEIMWMKPLTEEDVKSFKPYVKLE